MTKDWDYPRPPGMPHRPPPEDWYGDQGDRAIVVAFCLGVIGIVLVGLIAVLFV